MTPTMEGTGSRVLSRNLGSPVVADVDAVLAAVEDNGAPQAIVEDITNPPQPRNITATTDGKAEDVKAIQVKVTGTNVAGEVITETLPPFTVNTKGTVVGSKAFATVTKVEIPAHDGEEATTSIGFGEKLGLGVKLSRNSVLRAFLGGALEATAPTVAVSASALESNTVDLNSALNGTEVLVDYYQTA